MMTSMKQLRHSYKRFFYKIRKTTVTIVNKVKTVHQCQRKTVQNLFSIGERIFTTVPYSLSIHFWKVWRRHSNFGNHSHIFYKFYNGISKYKKCTKVILIKLQNLFIYSGQTSDNKIPFDFCMDNTCVN